ncbi:MAG: hypothetical protein M1819_007327 [Sarea resinae]|nr:MAG: hypothetical protein M1819_007327 [Sarea resinae]
MKRVARSRAARVAPGDQVEVGQGVWNPGDQDMDLVDAYDMEINRVEDADAAEKQRCDESREPDDRATKAQKQQGRRPPQHRKDANANPPRPARGIVGMRGDAPFSIEDCLREREIYSTI